MRRATHALMNLLIVVSAALLLALTPASAQGDNVAASAAQLVTLERELAAVDRATEGEVNDDARRALRTRAAAAGKTAEKIAGTLTEQVALVDAQIAGLGAATADESDDLKAQRARLAAERSTADTALRRGGLLAVQADQIVTKLNSSEAEAFAQAVSARVPSPLTPAFWGPVLASVPKDFERIGAFFTVGSEQIARQWRATFPWQVLLCGVIAVLLVGPARGKLRDAGQRFLIEDAPGHRVRRSGFALWRVVVGTLAPVAAAIILVQGLHWSGQMPQRLVALLQTFIGATGFAGFTASVTGTVLMRSQPSWRIADIADDTANRLKPLSWILAGLAFTNVLLLTFNTAVGASRDAIVASQAVMTALHLVLIGGFLLILARVRGARADEEDLESLQTRAGVGLVELILWLVTLTSAGALLLGYIGLAYAIVQFIAWSTVVGCATFILTRVIDDLLTTLLTRRGRFGQMLTRSLGLRGSAIDQVGLILSGFVRGIIIIIALGLVLFPFGAGGGLTTLFARLSEFAQGVEVAGIAISPGTIIRGIVVLLIGLALVRAFMAWLENRYLPVTELDGSGRNSVGLVARYVGISLAVIWALASLGIGVEKIALLLSALSVGIGFGLQAITQNFISGLILLAERPIKIGDLIRVGDEEGDVRRISVRSTEIELADHSTLIVPNSELITKSVVNKTPAGTLGRIQIKFSVPISADAEAVQQILLDAFDAEEAVIDEPPPKVFIDSIVDDRIVFNSLAHVAGPRAVYSTRSAVYRTVLRRLREEGIDIGTPPQQPIAMYVPPPPGAPEPKPEPERAPRRKPAPKPESSPKSPRTRKRQGPSS